MLTSLGGILSKSEGAGIASGSLIYLDSRNSSSYGGTGTTWFDLSGNGNDATLVNGVGFSASAMQFDGVDDYVNANYSYSLASGEVTDFTVTSVINTSDVSNDANGLAVSCYNGTPIPFYYFINDSTGLVSATSRSNGGTVFTITSTTVVNDGLDHTITYRKNGSIYTLFIDGVSEATTTTSIGATSSAPIILGRLSVPLNQSRYKGGQYGFVFYDKALTNTQVSENSTYLLSL